MTAQPETSSSAIHAPRITTRTQRGGAVVAGSFAGVLVTLTACGDAADAPAADTAGLVPMFASVTPEQTQGLPLSLVVQPMSAVVEEGAPVRFVALAVGAPPLRYQWLRDGVPIAGADDAVLQFTAARTDAGASFAVAVSNAADRITSWPATLDVEPVEQPRRAPR